MTTLRFAKTAGTIALMLAFTSLATAGGKTMEKLMERANMGDASAQQQLAEAYGQGADGLEQNHSQAFAWSKKAADQGNPKAQNQMGVYFAEGRGTPQDFTKAAEWFRKAAEQGFGEAQYNLGVLYANGQGVEHSDSETVKWTSRAAYQGIPSAQYSLGLLFAVGAGTPQDYVKAHAWFVMSLSHLKNEEREMAEEDLALVVDRMTPEEIAQAKKLAADIHLSTEGTALTE